MDINLVITKMFDDNKKLGIRTLKKRTGLSHRQVKKLVCMMVKNGQLRRVHPSEVGSNKFYSKPCPTDEEWMEYGKETKNGKFVNKLPSKERRNIHITMMNEKKFDVFARA